MAHLNLVPVGPAVAPLVPCGFDVVSVGGAGAVVVRCDDGRDYGRCDGYGGGHSGECLLYILYCF